MVRVLDSSPDPSASVSGYAERDDTGAEWEPNQCLCMSLIGTDTKSLTRQTRLKAALDGGERRGAASPRFHFSKHGYREMPWLSYGRMNLSWDLPYESDPYRDFA